MSTTQDTPAKPEIVKITVLRGFISNSTYSGKKGETIEVPVALAKAWTDAKFAKYADAK